jgi:adenosyl cobinamide kinase/adenosyl cobinamide phosphate guanylyltransferase
MYNNNTVDSNCQPNRDFELVSIRKSGENLEKMLGYASEKQVKYIKYLAYTRFKKSLNKYSNESYTYMIDCLDMLLSSLLPEYSGQLWRNSIKLDQSEKLIEILKSSEKLHNIKLNTNY